MIHDFLLWSGETSCFIHCTLKVHFERKVLHASWGTSRQMLISPFTAPYNFTRKELGTPGLNIDPSGGQSQAGKYVLVGFVRCTIA